MDGGHDAGRDGRNASAVPAAIASAEPRHTGCRVERRAFIFFWRAFFPANLRESEANELLDVFGRASGSLSDVSESDGR